MSTKRSDEELRQEIYAVLFSVGKRMLIDEIAKVVKERDKEKVKRLLDEIKEGLEQERGPVMLMQDGEEYKLAVRGKFLGLVQKVVKHAEMPKSILETLAVLAYKSPVLQSDIIKIRTNKAYDHLKALEEEGYITREKHGRTKLIKVTQKFFHYFEISPEELQKKMDEKVKEENIVTIKDTVKGFESYGEHKLEQTGVETYTAEKEEPEILTEKEPVEFEEPELETEKIETETKEEETPVEFIEPEKEEKDEPTKIEKKLEELEHDKVIKKKKKTTEEEIEEYEPIKVKGGFKEFSEEEKEKIKEKTEEIQEGD